jgi:Ca-activated chloride channel family protein
MSTEFHFIRPYWLIALIPCFIFVILTLKHKFQRGNWNNVCDEALLPYILQQKPTTQKKGLLISTSIAAVLAIFALAGPAWERLPVPVFRNDSGLVIALDLSRSMLANDIKPSRLIRARYKITDILKQRKDGQTALIVYAGDAFTVTPLTTDNATIAGQLNALTPEIIPRSGSNTVLALEQAISLFKQAGLQRGHILLITDEINLAQSVSFIKQSTAYQVSVLAVGTENGAPIKLPQGDFLKDKQGNIVVPKLSLNELQQLATAGKGILEKISDDDSDIKALLSFVDNSIKNTAKNEPQENLLLEQWDDKGAWLLLLVLPLIAANFKRGLLTLAFLLILPLPKNSYAFEWQDLWETNNQQAQKLYQQQDFKGAAETFDDPLWKAAAQYKAGQYDKVIETLKDEKTADSFYNQGNALAKSGQLAEALKAYEQALKLDSGNEDSQFNKKLVEDALEKQKQEKQKQEQQDKNNSKDEDEKKENKETEDLKDDKKDDSKDDSKDSEDNQSSDDKSQSSEPENKPQENAEKKPADKESQQAKEETPPEKEQANKQPASAKPTPIDETKQADAQWLNRIPDDPSGLLRRKFEYQYKLRKRDNNDETQAW